MIDATINIIDVENKRLWRPAGDVFATNQKLALSGTNDENRMLVRGFRG